MNDPPSTAASRLNACACQTSAAQLIPARITVASTIVIARGIESGEFDDLMERIPLPDQRAKWKQARSGWSEADLAYATSKIEYAVDKVEAAFSERDHPALGHWARSFQEVISAVSCAG